VNAGFDSGYVFDVNTNYSNPNNKPVRWLAQGRDATAAIDSAFGGFGKNDGDKEITGTHVSDGDTGRDGILGEKVPHLFRLALVLNAATWRQLPLRGDPGRCGQPRRRRPGRLGRRHDARRAVSRCAARRQARCASYVPNSSRSALQISPIVTRARSAWRIGTSKFPSPPAVSRTAASERSASSAFRSARTRAVRSS
jgi:hypothetical protein